MKPLLILLLFLFFGCTERSNKHFAAPPESDVTQMILGSDSLGEEEPDTGMVGGSIDVPKSFFGSLLSQLNGATKNNDPQKWVAYADLWISTRSGEIVVNIYQTGEKTGAFRVNGEYYRTADEAALIRTIQILIQQAKEQKR